MSALVMITGAIYKAPETKTAKSGKSFWTATIRTKEGEGSTFWRVTTFSETAGAELMRLGIGEGLCAQGSFKAEIYDGRDGEKRLALTCFADSIIPLRKPPGKAFEHKAEEGPRQSPAHDSWAAPTRSRIDADFNDDIPF
jgi:single-stranded DNA-binding protein